MKKPPITVLIAEDHAVVREGLRMVAEGSADKQIADALSISIKTVEKHRQKLMDKLNIHDTAGLTRHAISTGVIENCVQVTTGE